MTDPACATMKKSLRAEVRARLAALAEPDLVERSAGLRDALGRSGLLGGARCVGLFARHGAEPDLLPLLPTLAEAGVRVALPRAEWDGIALSFGLVHPETALVAGRFGLREPPPGAEPAGPRDLDAVLVPGLAFDLRGGRLGRGGGFYDRFLAACPGLKIGCCFETQLVDVIPMEAHDARVDAIATEARAQRVE